MSAWDNILGFFGASDEAKASLLGNPNLLRILNVVSIVVFALIVIGIVFTLLRLFQPSLNRMMVDASKDGKLNFWEGLNVSSQLFRGAHGWLKRLKVYPKDGPFYDVMEEIDTLLDQFGAVSGIQDLMNVIKR